MCANWGATTTVLAKSTTKSDTSKKQIDIVSDQLGQKIVVYDGHHFRQAPDQNGALLFRCVRYEWSKCPANILVTKRTKTIGLPHNHDDFAISTDELKIEPNKSGLMNLISTPQEVNRNTIKGSVTRRVTLASKSKRGRKLNMPDTIDNDTSIEIIKRPRGRPPKSKLQLGNKEMKSDEIIDLALREKGEPVTYVSVIKGGMAILYDGHHFKPVFKRNGCMFYRCIRFDTKKCPARVLVHQSMVYPVDMAHCHEDNALMDQHGSIVVNPANFKTQPKQEAIDVDSESEVKNETVIYEIITLPAAAPQHIINSSTKIKAEIDDIITLPSPIVIDDKPPTMKPGVVLPPGIIIKSVSGAAEKVAETTKAAVTTKTAEPTKAAPLFTRSSRSASSPSTSKPTILTNEPIIPSRLTYEKKTYVAATKSKSNQSENATTTKSETKPTLEKFTSEELKEKMKNRLKMALLKAKK